MRIAIVGSGAGGLSALWALDGYSGHEVEIFEMGDQLGGHACAIDVQQPGKEPCRVDTGFVMLNQAGYPNFWSFLNQTEIPLVQTDTSFSMTRGDSAWGSRTLSSLFASTGSWYNLRVWRMMFDLFRFHYRWLDVLNGQVGEEVRVGEYLEREGYGDGFKEDYLLPLAATYWSLPPARVMNDCPIVTLVRSFHNHGLLQLWNRPRWSTIGGGSKTYIETIETRLKNATIHKNTEIISVEYVDDGVVVWDSDGVKRHFDHVIMATHADTTLKILRHGKSLSTFDEKALMDASEWSRFDIVMHWDERLMPDNPKVWGAWNSLLPDPCLDVNKLDPMQDSVSCTFDMNRLHDLPLSKHGHILGTLNPPKPIDPAKIFASYTYSTPIFTSRLLRAQRQLTQSANGRPRVSLVGAWMGLGTHEDAWRTGLEAAKKLGARVPFPVQQLEREVEWNRLDMVMRAMLDGLKGVGIYIELLCVWLWSEWMWSGKVTKTEWE